MDILKMTGHILYQFIINVQCFMVFVLLYAGA